MVSIDDLGSYVIGLFKEPIIGSLKSKMAEIAILKIDMMSFLANRLSIWTVGYMP